MPSVATRSTTGAGGRCSAGSSSSSRSVPTASPDAHGEAARQAAAEDGPRLAALHQEARTALAGARGGPELLAELEGELPPAEQLVGWGDPPDRCLVVGTYEDTPVGYALARVGVLGGWGPRVARLLWLFVEPAAREVGVGRCLLEAVTSWSLAVGASGLDVPVLPGDRSMKALLEAGGHRARLVVMHRDLATSPPTGPVAVAR